MKMCQNKPTQGFIGVYLMGRSLETIEITIPERSTKGFRVLKVVLMSSLMRQCIAKKGSISEFISFVRLESG